MGKGIDIARALGPEHAALLDDLKDQLLIVFLKRLVGEDRALVVPVSEVDDTGQNTVSFALKDGAFHFTVGRKH